MASVVTEEEQQLGQSVAERYMRIRGFSDVLCEPLSAEDCTVQSMPDASPTRWHLAHTTWFFEEFVLSRRPGYRTYNDAFRFLFNSYYNSVGKQYPRPRRGCISRPSLGEICAYRQYVDDHLAPLLEREEAANDRELRRIVEIGINHEQQHQELILTDIKHALAQNPLWPVYREGTFEAFGVTRDETDEADVSWLNCDEGLYHVGHDGNGFAYDNEGPRHRVFLERFALSNRLVTCGEYLAFLADGGYERPELWLSDGWRTVQEQGWEAPLYWTCEDGVWAEFTLSGRQPIDPLRPVCHVSYFEADAFARWAGARLPTEFEWEVASEGATCAGNFAEEAIARGRAIHPSRGGNIGGELSQMFGDVWEWTASQYVAYPGYQPPDGALGEYNGKFMCNQFLLRGGSCATSQSHIRRTYRNFFPPEARWQFSGIRLAR